MNNVRRRRRWDLQLQVRAGILAVLILAVVLGACGGAEPAPMTEAGFRQLLLAGGELEAGRTIAAADLATIAGCPAPALYDSAGTVRDLSWLVARFGSSVAWSCVDSDPAGEWVFRLVELRESCGPAIFLVRVRDQNGNPLEARAVVRGWPGAPVLPEYGPPASRYSVPETDAARGVVGWTSDSGDVGFGLGVGDYYDPANSAGASWIYIADLGGPSDLVVGLGMLMATEHCALWPVYDRVPADTEPPTPTPTATATVGPGTPTVGPTDPTLPEGLIRIEEFWIKPAPAATVAP